MPRQLIKERVDEAVAMTRSPPCGNASRTSCPADSGSVAIARAIANKPKVRWMNRLAHWICAEESAVRAQAFAPNARDNVCICNARPRGSHDALRPDRHHEPWTGRANRYAARDLCKTANAVCRYVCRENNVFLRQRVSLPYGQRNSFPSGNRVPRRTA